MADSNGSCKRPARSPVEPNQEKAFSTDTARSISSPVLYRCGENRRFRFRRAISIPASLSAENTSELRSGSDHGRSLSVHVELRDACAVEFELIAILNRF